MKVTGQRSIGWGSGTIINWGRQGTEILTNKHVIGSGGVISIDDGTGYWAGVRCREVWPMSPLSDAEDDIAVIMAEKLPPSCAYVCEIGYQPVEPLYAIGSSKGRLPTVVETRALERWQSGEGYVMKLAATSYFDDGDSGGGVYDSRGVLVGVLWGRNNEGAYAVDLTRSTTLTAGTRQKSQARAVSMGMH